MKEFSQGATEKKEFDPRRKDEQGLEFWAAELLNQGLISRKDYDDFISGNNSKELQMDKRGLPQSKHFGIFNSVEEIQDRIKPKKDERFIIRCSDKKTGNIKRLIDGSFDEIINFAKELPGGFDNWSVEVKEFSATKAAGTIIITPSGRATIETWHGPHYLNTQGDAPKYYAQFDPEQFDRHYAWTAPDGAEDLDEMKMYAMKAIKYIFPYLKPKANNPIYIEYAVKPSGEVYFIEASDSPVLTGK